MFLKRAIATALACLFLSTGALAQSRTLQQETIACQDDAVRLCGPYIPDHGKIHACLLKYKTYLAPPCRAIVGPSHHHHHHKG